MGGNTTVKLVSLRNKKRFFIKFAWVEAKSTYNGYDESIGEKNNVLKAWEDFLSDHASDSLGKPYITGGRTDIFGFFMYTVSQLMFVNGAVWSVVISSLIAFLIVFIFTKKCSHCAVFPSINSYDCVWCVRMHCYSWWNVRVSTFCLHYIFSRVFC